MERHANLARTPETFDIDACCAFGTYMQGPFSLLTLHDPDTTYFSHFSLRVSCDPFFCARGRAAVMVALEHKSLGCSVRWNPDQHLFTFCTCL